MHRAIQMTHDTTQTPAAAPREAEAQPDSPVGAAVGTSLGSEGGPREGAPVLSPPREAGEGGGEGAIPGVPPAPYTASRDGHEVVVTAHDGRIVAEIRYGTVVQQWACARLIAAAPALYHALADAQRFLGHAREFPYKYGFSLEQFGQLDDLGSSMDAALALVTPQPRADAGDDA